MLIGIVSDTHSRYGTLSRALLLLRRRDVTTVLHCGDIEDPETVEMFRGLTAHFVFGNCDTDRGPLRAAMADAGVTLHEPFGHLELAGRTLAFLHGDDRRLLHDLEASGAYDYLFHGHTHQTEDRRAGPTRVINPGALHRARPKTFAVLDLADGRLESVEVPEA
jgi:putative phosphoesterase